MKTIEVSAKSREAAIDMALAELGVERHEIEVEIVDEGAAGFLGMGRRDVRIKVSADVADAPAHVDRPRRDRQESKPEGGRDGNNRDRGGREGSSRGRRGGRNRGGRGRDRDGNRDENREAKSESSDRPRNDRGPRDGNRDGNREAKTENADRPRNDRGGRDRNRGGNRDRGDRPNRNSGGRDERPRRDDRPRANNRDAANGEDRKPAEQKPAPPKATPAELEARGTEGAALLQEVIAKMGIESTVTHAAHEESGIQLNVASEDSAILIGRKGQTLRSLQYLINRMMHEGEVDAGERIVIDVEGYLDRRREKLSEMAERMAERAKEDRRRVRLKPLNAQERRMIHVALAEDPDVRTFSVGSSEFRSVVIAPKDELPDERGGRGGRGGRNRGGRGRDRDHDRYADRPQHDEDRYADDEDIEVNGNVAEDVEDTGADYPKDSEELPPPPPGPKPKAAPRREPVAKPETEAKAEPEPEPELDDLSRRRARRRRSGGFRGRQAVAGKDNGASEKE